MSTGVSISTTTKRTGSRSLRVNPSASNSFADSAVPLFLNTPIAVMRFYVNIASNPTSDAYIGGFTSGANRDAGLCYKSSDGKYYAGYSDGGGGITAFGATGITLSTGTWYCIDVKYNGTSNPLLVDVQVDGTALGQASTAQAAANAAYIRLGCGLSANETFDVYYDDLVVSTTSADYPIGAGHVDAFIPTSDGTHTATGTDIVKGTAAAPTAGGAITSATTDAFNWVNAQPLGGGATDATRLINQQTAAAAEYVEVKFGNGAGVTTPTVAPRAVEVVTADKQAATQTCNFQIKLNDNGTENVIVNRGTVAGILSDTFTTKQYATGPAGAWTALSSGAGGFNNLRARFGYSSDATPDVYWRGIMVEAEFADAAAPSGVPNKVVQVGTQGMKRASFY